MSQISCGVDLGTTNVKVTLVDEAGRSLWTSSVPTPRRLDEGRPATDTHAIVDLLEDMIIAGWREVGLGKPLASIASAGVGEDGIGVGSDLAPTGLAIPWFDDRAAVEARELQAGSLHAARAGLDMDPARTAAKWLWLRRHRPTTLADAAHWLALTDYPSAVWSGQPFMSETLAARTACYDVYERRWIEPLLAAAGAPPLPPVLPAGRVLGCVRGGRLTSSGAAGDATTVVAGGHDHMIAASAVRRLSDRAIVDSMGTANLLYAETADVRTPRTDRFVAFSVPATGGAGQSCLGVFELAAAIASLRRDPDLVTAALSLDRLPGLPAAAHAAPRSRSAGDPTTADVRAGLEDVSLRARRMLDAILEAGAPAGPIFATGGWSRSRGFMELRASVYGQPITVVDEPELTAVGAALVSAEGAGNVGVRFGDGLRRTVVEPVTDWVGPYEALYAARRERLAATASD
jgi:xylulokinase